MIFCIFVAKYKIYRNMNIVETILQEHSLNTEQSILMGQWEFDKKNIPNALKAIAIVFPHFSLHDESHSVSILNNIVKMLGVDNIKKLSCTDLWLLLESAFSHDLGMVVTAERLDETLKGEDILKHYLKITADENHPCYEYTKCFLIKGGKLYMREQELKTDKLDAVRFLLADYFRSKHAENSKKAISGPMDEAGISSPRTIIPQRLFGMLSDICRTHTQDFDAVMALPKNEDGIGLDECHPRFIACMLRLGDLLDIDNNRFSESLMKTIKAMPADSLTHYEKHKSISHLSINTKCIEIEAVCHSPKVAQVTQEWFDWISDEFKTQTLKWNSIVPDGIACYLPTLNYLRTKIEGYETVNDNKKPKFTIDTAKALELLQGKNFYNDPFDSIREIVQNAVDSTLIRIYQDAKKNKKHFAWIDDEFLDFAKKYPITVSLYDKSGEYIVEVKDHGTGMKRDHLTYLINTGSSSKNVEKRLIVDEMPEWMRPSGVFGIGFQSVFLLTDKVEIETKDYSTDEKMAIELYSPSSPMKGDVYLKKVEGTYDPGMTVRFTVKNNVKMNVLSDPFNALPEDIGRSMIEAKIREYADKSVVPIIVKHIVKGAEVEEPVERHKFDFYDEKTGIELSFSPQSFDFTNFGGVAYYYRNAKVGNGADIMFLSPAVNVHYGSAKDILTLDRGAFKDGKKVAERTIDAIINFMNSDKYRAMLERLGELSNNAAFKFSFFLEYYGRKNDIKSPGNLTDVNQFRLNGFGMDISLGEVVTKPILKFKSTSNKILSVKEENGILNLEANMLPIVSPNFVVEIVKLIFKMATENHRHCYCTERTVDTIFAGAVYIFTNDENIPDIKLNLKDIKSNLEGTTSRSFVNYIPSYDDIKIASDYNDDAIMGSFMTQPVPGTKLEKIISPFIHINGKVYDCRNDEMYTYVSEVTGKDVESVKASYDRFVREAVEIGVKLSKKE